MFADWRVGDWPQSPPDPWGPAWPAPACLVASCEWEHKTHTVKVGRLGQASAKQLPLAHYVSSCSWRLFSWSTALSFSCSTFSLSCSSTIFWFSLCKKNSKLRSIDQAEPSLHRTIVQAWCFLITPAARWWPSPWGPARPSDCWFVSDGFPCGTGSASPQIPGETCRYQQLQMQLSWWWWCVWERCSYLDFIGRLDLILQPVHFI